MTTRIAVAQLKSNVDPAQNLVRAIDTIKQAASQGAQLIVFPEIFMALLAKENFNAAYARGVSQALDGAYVSGLRRAAEQAGIWVVSGMLETETAHKTSHKTYNTTVVIDDHGSLLAFYRKTHLYDAFGFQESNVFASGEQLFAPLETPFGRMGLFVCYELRFPEIARYQAEQGVDFFVMPSAWVIGALKEMHWQHLVAARAIENTAYMFACDQVGNNYLGRSLLLDPLGVVLAEGTEGECLLYAEMDPQRLLAARQTLPALTHRRPALFTRN
ncbi:carbon-nitrogen hydrolase family protein [Dictyobacter kobayashii]|uniref:Hydrolase n=1 Tax=Dictyobacter kobayashii TaxID=2014872 RepID=A0A402AUE3_9CHLR|nr:carbon-nitrogen hydrolase family protein [Dictyobacter kobayashii]GCE22714.1 hydrolase [Dictyobacter kobayashii]